MKNPDRTTLGSVLTTDEIAARYRIEVDTVRGWLRRGILPSIRVGRRRYVREEDILFLEGKGGA